MKDDRELRRAWAEVDLAALRHNAAWAREAAGGRDRVMAVVKADGYGHGLRRVVEAVREEAGWFGVANVLEGRAVLREAPDANVFLLGALLPAERRVAVEHGMVVGVSSREEAEALQGTGLPVRVHLVIDTGMGRLGCLEKELDRLREEIEGMSRLQLEGIGTHLPVADEDREFTEQQLAEIQELYRRHLDLPFRHVSNSAGFLAFGDRQPEVTLYRPGLMLYGISPLPDYQSGLQPAMALKSRVTLVRRLPAGRTISYGRTFRTRRETLVATVGIGYGDGYPRYLSNRDTDVLVAGRRCALLGRVTMDQIMIDVTEIGCSVEPGAEVVLFGRQRGEEITATEIAERAGTIPWEILTGLTSRLPRFAGP